ncbi:MAG: YbbR-like domain-containing protein [Spirochaetota bacterium]
MASRSELVRRALENWPAKIIALGIAIVVVLFNDLADVSERYFSVPLELRLSGSVVPGQEHTNRVRVQLRGEEAQIFEVLEEDIVAYADFTEHTNEGVFQAPIEVERTGTALDLDALEISVEPATVTVTLEEKLIRSLEVVPNIAGFPPPGYELSDYRISPTTVDVEGPRSRVEDLTQILTEEISLSGRTADFSERVRLQQPDPLVEFPGGTIVDFRALIVETVIQTSFENIEVSIVDLSSELAVVSDVPTGTIRVQGKQLDVESVPRERIGLFVDAGTISEAGTYTLPVRPQIPGGILVLGIEPARIELTVIEAAAAAPRPAEGTDAEAGGVLDGGDAPGTTGGIGNEAGGSE